MSDFSRPEADTLNPGGYINELGGSSNLFQSIDEVVANDLDYVRSPNTPTADVIVFKLSTIADPLTSAGHILRVRAKKDASNPAQVDMRAQLREGYVNESSLGTLIATLDHPDVTTGFVTYTYTLTALEADAITDYSDLFLRLIANP